MRDLAAGLLFVIFSVGVSQAGDNPAAKTSAPATAATPASSAAADAAAARHARRIACRKEAADQKLTGDDKLDYIKDCIKKPAPAKP